MLYYNGLVQARISAAERLRATVQSRLTAAIHDDAFTHAVIEGAADGAVTAAITAADDVLTVGVVEGAARRASPPTGSEASACAPY